MATLKNVEQLDPKYADYPTDVGPVDPYAEIETEDIQPRWPDSAIVDLVQHARLSYDRRSDTLSVWFSASPPDSVSVQQHDYNFLLVDMESHEIVGLEIEKFLLRAVRDCPSLITALDVAELRGITPDGVQAEKAKLPPFTDLVRSASEGPIDRFTNSRHPRDDRKKAIVFDYFRNECRCAA